MARNHCGMGVPCMPNVSTYMIAILAMIEAQMSAISIVNQRPEFQSEILEVAKVQLYQATETPNTVYWGSCR